MDKKEEENLPVPVVKEFLNIQGKELEIRAQEISLREKELDNNHELALKSLEAQDKFFNKLPDERRKDWRYIFWFTMGGISVFIGFCIYLFKIGQDEVAKYIITAMVSALVSGGGSYGIGFHKGSKSSKNNNTSVEDI